MVPDDLARAGGTIRDASERLVRAGETFCPIGSQIELNSPSNKSTEFFPSRSGQSIFALDRSIVF
jgi:hypothetical protein